MKILVGQNHLNSLGGTETFTYTLVKYLKRLKLHVDVVTLRTGIMSDRIKEEFPDVGINTGLKEYDLALINHNSILDFVRRQTVRIKKVVQTCHGIVPTLEQPSVLADIHVSISSEVQNHLKVRGFESTVIYNGIDLEEFSFESYPSEDPELIVSLAQSIEANNILSEVAKRLHCQFISFNKNFNPQMNIQDALKKADLVFGLGRSAFEGMATGSNVFVWDIRDYMGNKGDGFITFENFHELMKNNASGRRYGKSYSVDQIVQDVNENYSSLEGVSNRHAAERYLNMEKQIEKYLDL